MRCASEINRKSPPSPSKLQDGLPARPLCAVHRRGREAHSRPFGHRDATMILLSFRHGLRASELCSLRWEQVDLIHARLHVSRGDIFEHAGMKPVRITITSGNEVTHAGRDRWHVAKTVLMSPSRRRAAPGRSALCVDAVRGWRDERRTFRFPPQALGRRPRDLCGENWPPR